MNDPLRDDANAQAIDWMVRQRAPDFADWDGLTQWLAASPAHAAAFHGALALDEDLGALPRAQAVVATPRRLGLGRRAWLGGAVAAMLVGVVGWSTIDRGSGSVVVETRPGERRTVVLPGGVRIAVDGGTRVVLDADDPRYARLDHGQAMFDVAHDAAHPFVVEVHGTRLVDLGTRFDVVRRAGSTAVAVAEGAVAYDPAGANVRIDAGRMIEAPDAAREVRLSRVEAGDVGSWQAGQRVYAGVPLAAVAEDLSRSTGVRISVAPEIRDLPFHGAVLVRGADRLARDVAALAGVGVRERGDGWLLMRGGP
jgi:transmembrane sensor